MSAVTRGGVIGGLGRPCALGAGGALGALGADDRTRILREETFAWEVGREVLAELGLSDFTLYDERIRRGLHYHRYRLGIDELWPDDV